MTSGRPLYTRVNDDAPVVLVVDDDLQLRSALHGAFSRAGWVVASAGSGAEARGAYEELMPDVVLLDLFLPDGCGLALLAELQSCDPDVSSILMSAYADVPNTVKALRLGVHSVLEKPLALDTLFETASAAARLARLKRRDRLSLLHPGSLESLEALGHCRRMRSVAQELLTLAPGRSPVLLLGETGTGKGHAARLLHQLSSRSSEPFVELNCAALTSSLLESELFGHERGAFTDARSAKRGLMEIANQGTLFLDEVAELLPDVQPKLLKAIEEQRFRRVGGTEVKRVDVRVVLASNTDLLAAVRSGHFREDLYYRLAGSLITIPPLRERDSDELLRLAQLFQLEEQRHFGRGPVHFSAEAAQALLTYRWPGNVRELRSVMATAVLRAINEDVLQVHHLRLEQAHRPDPVSGDLTDEAISLRELERRHIALVLMRTKGNRVQTARILGVTRTTLYKKLAEFELEAVGKD